ncbi:hypothetical protein M569_14772, partial [Genlisea aurea]
MVLSPESFGAANPNPRFGSEDHFGDRPPSPNSPLGRGATTVGVVGQGLKWLQVAMGRVLGGRPMEAPPARAEVGPPGSAEGAARDMVAEAGSTVPPGTVETGLCEGGEVGEGGSLTPHGLGSSITAPQNFDLVSSLPLEKEVAERLALSSSVGTPPSISEGERDVRNFSEDEREGWGGSLSRGASRDPWDGSTSGGASRDPGEGSTSGGASRDIRMIAAGGEEEEMETPRGRLTEAERRLILDAPPASPPTSLMALPAMEVDFGEQDLVRPSPPPTVDARALWEEFAALHQKLGHFGRSYQH